MKYISTRGDAPVLGFEEALLAGLASDGGLYVPESWPRLSKAMIAGFSDKSFQEIAVDVLHPFMGDDVPRDRLAEICLLYTSPSPRDLSTSRMPSSA